MKRELYDGGKMIGNGEGLEVKEEDGGSNQGEKRSRDKGLWN